jgi:hypothetical protein
MKWNPIATAPKDGTRFLARNSLGEVYHCRWLPATCADEVDCWWNEQSDDEGYPKWWMPADAEVAAVMTVKPDERNPAAVAAELADWRAFCECTKDHQAHRECDGNRCVGQQRAIEAVLKNHPMRVIFEHGPDEELDREIVAEIERLTADKAAVSQTTSDYLHEIERLRAELAAERERCAKIAKDFGGGATELSRRRTAEEIEAAIRKGEPEQALRADVQTRPDPATIAEWRDQWAAYSGGPAVPGYGLPSDFDENPCPPPGRS